MILRLLTLVVMVFSSALADQSPFSTVVVQGMAFTLLQTNSFKETHPNIKHAIIVIHGSTRDSKTYYDSIMSLIKTENVADHTAVLAPHFKEEKDSLAMNEPFWANDGWERGDAAVNTHELSSFTVIDRLVEDLVDTGKFQNLKQITFAGHSDGAQLVQRYAFGNQNEKNYPHIQFRYVVANPGTYLYLSETRTDKIFSSCKEFNEYKYGLENLNSYLKQADTKTLITNFTNKNVIYLAGDQDTSEYDLDSSCAGIAQGSNRFERAQNYKTYLDQEFKGHQHQFIVVPGVGHTQYGMFHSPQGTRALIKIP